MSSSVSVPPIDISKIQPHHHEKYEEDLNYSDIDRVTSPEIKTWQCLECKIAIKVDICPLCKAHR